MPRDEDVAHIDLFVNDVYKLTFGYPVNVPEAMAILNKRLDQTKYHTDDITQTLGSLVQDRIDTLPTDCSTMTLDDQKQFVFLLCGFLKHLCEESNDTLEAGSFYHFKLILDDDGIIAEMYDVIRETIH